MPAARDERGQHGGGGGHTSCSNYEGQRGVRPATSRDLGVQYKTAFVLAHKIRKSLLEQRDMSQLSGVVHMDGAYVNGYIRPENKKEDRIDRRLAEHQKPNKRCVFVMRQQAADTDKGMSGATRTLTFILKTSENQIDVGNLVNTFVKKGSIICADESNAYDVLHAKFDTRRVNHSIEYRSDKGITNNLAESFFSRFRRMQYGQMHKFGTLHLAGYANEAAFREDNRRQSTGQIFVKVTKAAPKPALVGFGQVTGREIKDRKNDWFLNFAQFARTPLSQTAQPLQPIHASPIV